MTARGVWWTCVGLVAAFAAATCVAAVLRAAGVGTFWGVVELVTAVGAVAVAAGAAVAAARAGIGVGREQPGHAGLDDSTIGLLNRAEFLELVAAATNRSAQEPFAIVKLQPAFPHLLDSLTPEEAEQVLSKVVVRITGCLGPGQMLARTSAKTFATVVPGDAGAAHEFVQRVMLTAELPIGIGHPRLNLALVAGIAAGGPSDPAVLTQQATTALNSVAGMPGGVATFTPSMQLIGADNFKLREAVVGAVRDGASSALRVLFEPIVYMESGRLAGVSARVALDVHPFETISAGRLIAAAREEGVAELVDETILSMAVERFGEWSKRWPNVCGRLWIGVWDETLTRTNFPDWLGRLLNKAGLPAQAVVLETYDGAGGRVPRDVAHRALRLVRDSGVSVVVNDSLAMASQSLGVDAADDVEADFYDVSPALVDRCVTDLRAHRLIQAIAEFAASRHAAAAARQVVTIEQHDELRLAGCVLARGPLYGRTLPADDTEQMLAAVAEGTWQTPAGQKARRHRSSQAWQELRTVISGLPITAFACDTNGTLVLAEGGLLGEFGITDEILGRPFRDVVSVLEADAPGRRLTDALEAALVGTPAVSKVRVQGRSLEVHLFPARDPHGTITGALGVSIDNTHRDRAEEALRNSENRFKLVFAHAPVGMVIVSPDGYIQEANAAFAAMLGYTPADLLGRAVASMWHPDSPVADTGKYLSTAVGLAEPIHAERAYVHRDGSVVWAKVTCGAMGDDRAPGTVIGVVEDLRPVKELEVQLRHAQKLEAVGMLAAGIAHEVNTPTQFVGDNLNFLGDAFTQLASLLAATQRLTRPVDDAAATELDRLAADIDLPWLLDEVPQAVSQGLAGVARVAAIVGAMRNFGHPDGQLPSPVDIDAAIRDTATVARNEFKYVADLELELGDVPTVLGYPSQFHQVVLNLIVNAAHAIEESIGDSGGRGTIRIRTWAEERAVCVSISDDGCGMPPETRSRIFDPFFTTKTVGRGTGQGLTIVHKVVVDRHHGTIDVDSTPGKGTRFTLRLPRPVADTTDRMTRRHRHSPWREPAAHISEPGGGQR
jgi:PAS domain S-box-containing protein